MSHAGVAAPSQTVATQPGVLEGMHGVLSVVKTLSHCINTVRLSLQRWLCGLDRGAEWVEAGEPPWGL